MVTHHTPPPRRTVTPPLVSATSPWRGARGPCTTCTSHPPRHCARARPLRPPSTRPPLRQKQRVPTGPRRERRGKRRRRGCHGGGGWRICRLATLFCSIWTGRSRRWAHRPPPHASLAPLTAHPHPHPSPPSLSLSPHPRASPLTSLPHLSPPPLSLTSLPHSSLSPHSPTPLPHLSPTPLPHQVSEVVWPVQVYAKKMFVAGTVTAGAGLRFRLTPPPPPPTPPTRAQGDGSGRLRGRGRRLAALLRASAPAAATATAAATNSTSTSSDAAAQVEGPTWRPPAPEEAPAVAPRPALATQVCVKHQGTVGGAWPTPQVRRWPAWKCVIGSHPGTPTLSLAHPPGAPLARLDMRQRPQI